MTCESGSRLRRRLHRSVRGPTLRVPVAVPVAALAAVPVAVARVRDRTRARLDRIRARRATAAVARARLVRALAPEIDAVSVPDAELPHVGLFIYNQTITRNRKH